MSAVLLVILTLVPASQVVTQKMEAANERRAMEEFDKYGDSLYKGYTMGEVFNYPKEKKGK